jgi:ferredoxin
MHCDKAPCIEACPVEGALYKRGDGMVIIDPVKCTGCRLCVDACPYDVIFFNEDLNIAQKCTGCAHLLDAGWTEPRCVDVCPTLALRFLEEDEAKELIQGAEQLHPKEQKPRVYYLNLPKRFIAGTLYDPKAKEVVIGAELTLRSSGATWTTATDRFGDFWFQNLDVGMYDLEIAAAGFAPQRYGAISTDSDVNLGDIPLVTLA